jgi:DNA-binding HxlR family transcriptional regulator
MYTGYLLFTMNKIEEYKQSMMHLQDAMDVINGKWKLIILLDQIKYSSRCHRKKRATKQTSMKGV